MDAKAQALLNMVKKVQADSKYTTMPEVKTLADYGLGNVDCELCGNKGYILSKRANGEWVSEECYCMERRRSLRNIKNSGLQDMLNRYSFENYSTPDNKRAMVLKLAKDYCRARKSWFYIAGRSGSGKSHICTAICGELIKQGNAVKYMLWRDEVTQLKAGTTDREWYEAQIKKLKSVPVLYIDDFFKGKVTDADVNLAFEILNFRYNDSSKRTVISSELTLPRIMEIDEAIGGRIYERSKGYVIAAPDENWRLRDDK